MKFKKLIEKRNELVEKMNEMVSKADTETRALNEEEVKQFDAYNDEVKAIDTTLKLGLEERSMWKVEEENKGTQKAEVNTEELEKRAFASFIRTGQLDYSDVETRAAVNFEKGANGAVIPQTIANRIIETVKNIAPIYELSDSYDLKGKLVFPVYDETGGKIQCGYAEEFKALAASAGTFTSKTLEGFTSGALAKISKSLVNNGEFDIVNYVIVKVSEAIAEFLEQEFLNGTTGKMEGVLSSKQVVTSASGVAITADDLIDTQLQVPQRLRANGVWVVNPDTFKAIAKLKDKDGRYLLNGDIRNGYSYTLLGNPIFESDAMPKIAAGNAIAVFGNFKGLATKLVKDAVEIQLLQERYAEEHVLGVIGWIEADSKVIQPESFGVLKVGA